jgi:hypothetical protein
LTATREERRGNFGRVFRVDQTKKVNRLVGGNELERNLIGHNTADWPPGNAIKLERSDTAYQLDRSCGHAFNRS